MRLPLLLSALLLLPLTAVAEGRTSVHLFQFGSTNAPEAQTAFLNFRDLMSEKLPNLASELLAMRKLTGFADLTLKPVTGPNGQGLARPSERIQSLAARRNYWYETGALALLTGRVKRTQENDLAIRSTFFLGDLGRAQGAETITVELPFTARTYDTTDDSHSVAVLYAFAMDLAADCTKRSEVFFLLTQAGLRADAVAKDDLDLGKALGQIVRTARKSVKEACAAQ